MILSLDVGNSHLSGGIFDNNNLLLQFRYDTKQIGTSDQFGIFLRSAFRENNLDYTQITRIGVASVVPSADYTIRAACIKYLKQTPVFLRPGVKTGIIIKTNNPNEVGADLIAGAIAAKQLAPGKDLLVFDLGTATTCCHINAAGEFLGASIAPGMKLMMNALHNNTAKLLSVDIAEPIDVIGKNTKTAIQSGIYYATLGLMEQLIKAITAENNISAKQMAIIGTGGLSYLYTKCNIFDQIVPELVLLGIKEMLLLN